MYFIWNANAHKEFKYAFQKYPSSSSSFFSFSPFPPTFWLNVITVQSFINLISPFLPHLLWLWVDYTKLSSHLCIRDYFSHCSHLLAQSATSFLSKFHVSVSKWELMICFYFPSIERDRVENNSLSTEKIYIYKRDLCVYRKWGIFKYIKQLYKIIEPNMYIIV